MWASRFDLIAIALMNMADWVKTLLEESSEVSHAVEDTDRLPKSDWTAQHQQTLESVQKFKERLKAFGADDDLVDETLHFYHGLEEADLCTSPQETLKKTQRIPTRFH